jgi:hypothetical protein
MNTLDEEVVSPDEAESLINVQLRTTSDSALKQPIFSINHMVLARGKNFDTEIL